MNLDAYITEQRAAFAACVDTYGKTYPRDAAQLRRGASMASRRVAAQAGALKHLEAFCLMRYSCVGSGTGNVVRMPGCGHSELFWNCRDGVTPFCTLCPSCGQVLQHVSWDQDFFAPDHQPHYGQRLWRTATAMDLIRMYISSGNARTADALATGKPADPNWTDTTVIGQRVAVMVERGEPWQDVYTPAHITAST